MLRLPLILLIITAETVDADGYAQEDMEGMCFYLCSIILFLMLTDPLYFS